MYNLVTKKVILNHDVIFHDGGECKWKGDVKLEKPEIVEVESSEDDISPLPTNSNNNQTLGDNQVSPSRTYSLSSSEILASSPSLPRKVKRIKEIYQKINHRDDIVNFVLVSQVQVEPSFYEYVVKNIVWHEAKNVEIHAVKRNEKWDHG